MINNNIPPLALKLCLLKSKKSNLGYIYIYNRSAFCLLVLSFLKINSIMVGCDINGATYLESSTKLYKI